MKKKKTNTAYGKTTYQVLLIVGIGSGRLVLKLAVTIWKLSKMLSIILLSQLNIDPGCKILLTIEILESQVTERQGVRTMQQRP